jgi:hypothetical protein
MSMPLTATPVMRTTARLSPSVAKGPNEAAFEIN